MEKNKCIPFPQADDISKIFKIINISNQSDIKNKNSMKIILGGITDRQVQYYINAVKYFGILNNLKEFTKVGNEIRSLNEYEQKIYFCRLIVSDPVFGEAYFSEKILGCSLEREDVITIMKKHLTFDSEEIYKRRAQTVLKWIGWINSLM